MTVGEFRAWLDGFEAAMGGTPPNADQWKVIKDKLAKVSEAPKAAFREVKARGWNDGIRLGQSYPPLVARYR